MTRGWLIGWLCALAVAACGEGDDPGIGDPPPVLTRTDPAGAACAHGGALVRSGADRDGDGVLDDDEIATTTPICTDGLAVLTRRDEVPAGAQCAAGGTAVRSGADRDHDGALDDDEITHTDLVCAAAPPAEPTLRSRVKAAPTGACAGGGVVIEAGRDRDGDGALDDDEVERTEVQCGDTVDGDVIIGDDVDVARLAAVVAITGSLTVKDGDGLTALRLPALRVVGERLWIQDTTHLAEIDLPHLHRVGAAAEGYYVDLAIARNAALRSLVLHLDDATDRRIYVGESPALVTVDVAGPDAAVLSLGGGPALTGARLDVRGVSRALVTTVGIDVEASPSAEVQVLAHALQALDVRSNPTATIAYGTSPGAPIEVSDLTLTGQGTTALPPVRVSNNLVLRDTGVTEIDLRQRVSSLRLEDNHALVSARLDAVSLDVVASRNHALTTLDIRERRRFDGSPVGRNHVAVIDNPALVEAPWLADLERLRELTIHDNPGLTLPEAMSFELDGGHCDIRDVAGVRTLTLLTRGFDWVTLARTSVETLQVRGPILGNVQNPTLQLLDNPALRAVDVDAKVMRDATFRIRNNAVLNALSLVLPPKIGTLSIVENPKLSGCQAQALLDATEAVRLEEQRGNDDSAVCP